MAEVARPAQVSPEAVREELARVLSGTEFRTSKRSQEFLRYVVEHVLSGQADVLKERTIGIEVFGRSTDYDPGEDATVRVKAGEVRKRLGLYYSEQGSLDPVRIELPLGTYVPEFHAIETARAALKSPASPVPLPPESPAKTRGPVWVSLVALICFVAAGIIWLGARPGHGALDQFWGPVLTGDAPVLLSAAFVPVYGLDSDAHPNPSVGDFVLLNDQFVGGGDLIAISRLSSMLTRMGRPYRLKIGNQVSFQDLRTGPAILVGYSYTRWREISREMRFFIDGSRRPIGITDGGAPTPWSLPNLPADRHTEEDYAIVSRVFHPDTHAMLVEVAGITQYGTDAGADLVTNPELMTEALRGAPAGWQGKNLQLVVHVKVISGSPSSPKVVATHFW
ncbi:MAG TPA: hypothetical protein VIY49_06185 [Bryobacteraceae bacterium]